MLRVVIVGEQAVEVARRLKAGGFTPGGFESADYGPWDLGGKGDEHAVRVMLVTPTDHEQALRLLEDSRKIGWLPPLGWRMEVNGKCRPESGKPI